MNMLFEKCFGHIIYTINWGPSFIVFYRSPIDVKIYPTNVNERESTSHL